MVCEIMSASLAGPAANKCEASIFETCSEMDAWQKMGYFTYKARLRREINEDWADIDHDIWVSGFRILVAYTC